jgi:hypothetical protein
VSARQPGAEHAPRGSLVAALPYFEYPQRFGAAMDAILDAPG